MSSLPWPQANTVSSDQKPSASGRTTPTTFPTTLRVRSPSSSSNTPTSWLNAITGNLTEGLSWIEVQGGNVVNQAATNGVTLSGVGETIRGGLAGKGRALSGFGLSGITGLVSGSGASAEHGLGSAPGTRNSYDGAQAGNRPDHFQRGSSNGSAGSVVSDSHGPDFPPFVSGTPQRLSSRPNSFLGGISRPSSAQSVLGPSSSRPTSSASPDSTPKKPSLSSSASSPPVLANAIPPSVSSSEIPKRAPAPANLARLTSRPTTTAPLNGDPPFPTMETASGRLNAHRPSLSNPNIMINGSLPGTPISASASTTSLSPMTRSSSSRANAISSSSSGLLNSRAGLVSSSARASSYGPTPTGSSNTVGRSSSQRSHLSSHSDSNLPAPSSSSVSTSQTAIAMPRGQVGPTAAVTRPKERAQTPYKPGFQPQGVRNSRMEDFERGRRVAAAERGREEGRLGRRWGKLIDLHFNPHSNALSSASQPEAPPSLPRSPSLASSIADKRRSLLPNRDSIASKFDNIRAMDVWRGIRSVSGVGADAVEEEKKREVERGIVKWEEDSEVKRCRICLSLFSISNRKHHCRICGRIICSLPPTADDMLALATQNPSAMGAAFMPGDVDTASTSLVNPNTGVPAGIRREKCSFLLVADWRTGKGEVVEEGFVGWMQTDSSADGTRSGKKKGRRRKGDDSEAADPESPSQKRQGKPMLADEIQVKGVRACRDCWAVVSRKQKIADMGRVSGFSRLYDVLKEVEREIQDILPEFQDAMLAMNPESVDSPIIISPETVSMHKQLVMLFTQYDTLTKRIRAQPCEVGGNQERLQNAIARASSAFVAREAVIMQALPKLQKQRHKRVKSSLAASVVSCDSTPQASEAGSIMAPALASRASLLDEMAIMLQPLLEQEAQIEEYIREANAQRKFDDAQTLQTSLSEIRAEVARISAEAG